MQGDVMHYVQSARLQGKLRSRASRGSATRSRRSVSGEGRRRAGPAWRGLGLARAVLTSWGRCAPRVPGLLCAAVRRPAPAQPSGRRPGGQRAIERMRLSTRYAAKWCPRQTWCGAGISRRLGTGQGAGESFVGFNAPRETDARGRGRRETVARAPVGGCPRGGPSTPRRGANVASSSCALASSSRALGDGSFAFDDNSGAVDDKPCPAGWPEPPLFPLGERDRLR